jgi:hypothetical protein
MVYNLFINRPIRCIYQILSKLKEKTMANKKIWQGMLVLALVFGMMIVGCDDGNTGDTTTQQTQPDTTTQSVAKPTATPSGGNYTTVQTVTLATNTQGATIHYTLNGTSPTTSSTKYNSPISINTTTTLKAIAVKTGMTNSDILTETYAINLPGQVVQPTATPAGGNYNTAQTVTLATTTSSADIYYTLNGTAPTTSSTKYNSPISINTTTTLKAIAVKTGMTDSGILTVTYTITKLPAPTGLVTVPSANSIQVSWNAVSGAASYNVYRSDSTAGTYTSIGTTTNSPYNDTGVTPGDNYYYKVSAFTSGNVEGDLSGYVTGRIPTQTKAIEEFGFVDFLSVNGTINGNNISVTVPNIVNLTTLVPTIKHNGKSISPASDEAQDFTSPKQYTVTADDGTVQSYTVTVTVTNTTLATAFSWINSNAQANKTYTIVVQANESLAPVTINPSYSNVNIILSGGTAEKTINLSSNGSLFTLSRGTLTLENNITLSGRSSNNASLVKLNSSGTLIMKTGSKIQNNTVTINDDYAEGGGVYIYGGTFTMDGGTISGNRVEATSSSSSYSISYSANGGGVYFDSGTFIMNNGTISNNTAYSIKFPTAGGGVYIGWDTFTMNGGTISDNKAESSSIIATSYTYGGGVYASWFGTFTMKGGTISGNTVSSADNRLGGGVYVRNDKFTKTGGTIYGSNASPSILQNTAKNISSGHAVYVSVDLGSTTLKRNTTAGTTVNMDSSRTGSAGGWE